MLQQSLLASVHGPGLLSVGIFISVLFLYPLPTRSLARSFDLSATTLSQETASLHHPALRRIIAKAPRSALLQ